MKIYLAGPYSNNSKSIMNQRAKELTYAAGILINNGFLVYSPITHSKPIADMFPDFPHNFDFWKELDHSMIKDWADIVWVLPLEGWDKSVGVKGEIEFASSLKKPSYLAAINASGYELRRLTLEGYNISQEREHFRFI